MPEMPKVIWVTPNITPRWIGAYDSIIKGLRALGLDAWTVGYYNECYIGHRMNPLFIDRISNPILSTFNPKAKLNKLMKKLDLFEVTRFSNFLLRNQVDVVITTTYSPGLHRAARRAGTRTILWSVDDTATHCQTWFEYAAEFDHVLTYSKGSVGIYRKNGCSRVDWLPLAIDTEYYFPRNRPILYDFSFVGNNLADRSESFRMVATPLMNNFDNIHMFGDGWDPSLPAKVHGPVDWRRIPDIYSASKIVFTIHRNTHKLVEATINARVFEALGCRSFLLSDNPLGLEQLFENKKELVIANSAEEALELARFYLEESELRKKIAENGHAKVVNQHTTRHRAQTLASVISHL